MNFHRKLIVTAAVAALPFAAMAQTTGNTSGNMYDRNVEQQNRIEQGLRTGDLNVKEASRLEREESGVSRMESRALRDGSVSDAERARINSAQDRVSQDIARERQDGNRGNPNSVSSQRMQSDVQRNIDQQGRIDQGVRSGQITNREAGRLENGQARVDRREGRAGADGHINGYEQRRIQGGDNRQSRQIYNERHDGQYRRDGDERRSWGRNERSDGGFRHDGGYRQSSNYRHEGDFRGNQQAHSFQQPSFQQHSFQQRSFAQAGGRRSR
jgi:hypothetical protein